MFTPSSHRLPIVYSLLIAITVALPMGVAPSTAQQAPYVAPLISTAIDASFRSSPVMFIENAGQWDERARFQVWGGPTKTMWLAEDAIWITVVERSTDDVARSQVDPLARFDPERATVERENVPRRSVNIKLSFVGANPHPRIEPFDRLDTVVSYFIGNEPEKWRPDVPVWGGVRYVDLYPGVDLEITSEGGQMVQRLAARPGADLSAVQIQVAGIKVMGTEGRTLRLASAAGILALPLPNADFAFTVVGDVEVGLASMWTVASGGRPTTDAILSAFQTPTSSENPIGLLYSTFLGGSLDDYAYDIAVDTSGRAYIAGDTWSRNFPTTPGAFDPTLNGYSYDAFVVRFSADGSALEYSTYLGGSASERGAAIAIDSIGRAYMLGSTLSSDFPVTAGAYDTSYDGSYRQSDLFLVRLNTSGSALDYGTFIGGSDMEVPAAIAVDAASRAYVTGSTYSINFPTTAGAFNTHHSGGFDDVFVTRVNSIGSTLEYSTFLGGSESDGADAIAVDLTGRVYIVGDTWSDNFPTTPGAFDTNHNGGYYDVFLTRLNANGSYLEYSTFLGGSAADFGYAVAVDAAGRAYVAGATISPDFPTTPSSYDTTPNSSYDTFVTRLNVNGSGLEYSTLLGGSASESIMGLDIGFAGRVYIAGNTDSTNFPITPNALDVNGDIWGDAFVACINLDSNVLEYSSYLGGRHSDRGRAIVVDDYDAAYVVGWTASSDFPTTSTAFDSTYNGGDQDAFVVKLAFGGAPTYAISGRVTDASGTTGISGVTVWAGFPHNTTTDANGNYTFMGLPAGTYTITPEKEPCTFAPTSQTVTIPPGKALPDFTSTRLASGLDICILQPGDILLKAGAPVGDYTDLIRAWIQVGGSYFTHSALYLGVTSDPQNPAQAGPRIAEAAGKKKLGGGKEDEVWETWLANTQWWDGANVTDWAVVRPAVSPEVKVIAIQYARDKAADPSVVFDFLADLDDAQRFYCSKLVWKSYQQAGVDVHKKTGLTGDLTSYWVTPEDLYFGSPVVQNMPGVDPSTRAFFRIYSPAHITLIDPLGQRTGFEPSSGGEVNEIPDALYTGTEAQIESVTVAGLGNSEGWRLLVTGYASGAYTLETGYLDARTRNWETHATTSEGKVDEFPAHPPNYPTYLPLLLK